MVNDAVNILHALELLPMDPDEQPPNVLPYPQWSILRSWFENPIPSLADIKRLQNTPGIPLRSEPNCYIYKCPHCSWINDHGAGDGHRGCGGPLQSRFSHFPNAVEIHWPTFSHHDEWHMYSCPGYTITPSKDAFC